MRFSIKYLYQVTLDQKLGSEFKPRKAPSETKKYTTIRICTNFSPNRGSVQTKQPLVQPRKIAKSYGSVRSAIRPQPLQNGQIGCFGPREQAKQASKSKKKASEPAAPEGVGCAFDLRFPCVALWGSHCSSRIIG